MNGRITLNYETDHTHLIIVNNKLMQTDKFFLRGSHSTLHLLLSHHSKIPSIIHLHFSSFWFRMDLTMQFLSHSFPSMSSLHSLRGYHLPNHSYQRGFSGKWWESEDCAVILCVIRGGNPRKHLSPSLLPPSPFSVPRTLISLTSSRRMRWEIDKIATKAAMKWMDNVAKREEKGKHGDEGECCRSREDAMISHCRDSVTHPQSLLRYSFEEWMTHSHWVRPILFTWTLSLQSNGFTKRVA